MQVFRVALLAAGAAWAQTPVSPDALRVDVSYLASDYLKGRGTPSPELDIAAGFIASQFSRAGLEPAGEDGYFQTAHLSQVIPQADGFRLTIAGTSVPFDHVWIRNAGALHLTGARITKVPAAQIQDLAAIPPGTVLVIENTSGGRRPLRPEIERLKPVATIVFASGNPAHPRSSLVADDDTSKTPLLLVWDAPAAKAMSGMHDGDTVDLAIAAPEIHHVSSRNVVGILRGSDPALRDRYLVVSAHYDHLGTGTGDGDQVFNGANDDASGTASLIEIAASLSAAKPKRSIVCIAFFGEEEGLVGSRYYVDHPRFPLDHTIADINLEQLGRTDDSEGANVARANLTGFDYSSIADVFVRAGKALGVEFVKKDRQSDAYFRASDNAAFAQAGIPAHTVSVSYEFPDYHKVSDEWPKLDYRNMAKVDDAIAAAVLAIADASEIPTWNAANPKTAEFLTPAKAKERSTPR
jgi:hypothetical protein